MDLSLPDLTSLVWCGVVRSAVSLRLQTNSALREEVLLREETERTGLLLQKYQQQLLEHLAAMQSSRVKFHKTMLSFAEVEKKVQAAQTLQRQLSEQRRRRQRRARIRKEKEREKEKEKGKGREKDKAAAAEGNEGVVEAELDLDREEGDKDPSEDVAEQEGPAFLPGEYKENWMVRFINANAIGAATATLT